MHFCKVAQILELAINTVLIAVLGLLIGIILGTIIAMVKVAPKYKWYMRFLNGICNVYVEFFRGTPMTVQLLLAYYVIVPLIGLKGVEALNVGIIVFGLNSAAYVSEIMRGGINSVDSGQLTAGRALGLSYPITMIKIVIPQAIKNILPTLGNEFIALIKETSVAGFIGAIDLTLAFRKIAGGTYDHLTVYLMMGIVYFVIVFFITLILNKLERKYISDAYTK